LFRALIERSNDGIHVLDPATGCFLDANESGCRTLGYTREELLRMTVFDVTKVDRATFEASSAKIEKTGHATEEALHRRKDGTTYPVEAALSFVTLDRKYMVAVVRDITARKKGEEKLKLFRALVDRSKDGIHVLDPATGCFLDANESACQALGYSREELLRLTVFDVKVGVDRAAFEASNGEIEKGGHATLEALHRRKDGTTYPVEAGLSFVTLDRKYLVAIVRDITARRQAEEALATERRLLNNLIRATPDIIYFKDREGRFTRVNEAFTRRNGASDPSAFLAKSDFDLFGEQHARAARADEERIMATGQSIIDKEEREDWKDRRVTWVSSTKMPLLDGAGKIIGIMGISRDVTERKKAEAEMESIHKQLVESSREAGMAEIATNVLHNVGNALNSVNISADLAMEGVKKFRISSLARIAGLLQEHAGDLGEFLTHDPNGQHVPAHLARLSEHLAAEQGKIAGELDSLRRNVEHIKDIVAMQQNYATVGGVKEMTDLVGLVEDSVRLNEGALSRHGVEIVRELDKVPAVHVEKHKILQILVNLVRNAKYACDESGRADRRLTVRVGKSDGRVRISVIDNGIGIPPENLTRIFNHGFTTRRGGHGFGLHGSALAAKEMGGSLTVESGGPGQGAAFTLELPCPKQEDAHE
jgi:PAS domain S-box-containing protein